eukprot:UN08219
MAVSRRECDELLVVGFMREISNDKIPADIMDLCVLWFHLELHFMTDYQSGIEFNQDATVACKKTHAVHSIYGSIVMASKCDIDMDYTCEIQIIEKSMSQPGISIGIDDAEQANIDKDFAGRDNTENYGYYSIFGTIYNHKTDISGRGDEYGETYTEGDIISMCYNPYHHTLSFAKNNDDQGVINNIVARDGLEYRLCIFLGYGSKGSVRLI